MADIVIPELADGEQEKFWAFFNGLGDHIEEEIYLPEAPRARLNLPVMIVGNKVHSLYHSFCLSQNLQQESTCRIIF